jgi:hypothetical protein
LTGPLLLDRHLDRHQLAGVPAVFVEHRFAVHLVADRGRANIYCDVATSLPITCRTSSPRPMLPVSTRAWCPPRRHRPPGRGEHMAPCQNARMDTEEINAIGTLLADLSQRTQQLRGYL